MFDNVWEEAPTTTLTTSELAWLSRLDACTGAVEWTALAGDDQLRTQVPGLLFDDFSGDLANRWTALVLDPDEPRAANWHPSGGVLLQDVDVAGGDASASSPDKPGTVYLSGEVDAADLAVETVAWAASGAYGLVFRWTDPQSYYRFSLEPRRSRLVKVDAGAVEELWSSRDGYVANAPTRLAVQAEGTRIRCRGRRAARLRPGGRRPGRAGVGRGGALYLGQRHGRVRGGPGAALAGQTRWRRRAATSPSWRRAGRCSPTPSTTSARSRYNSSTASCRSGGGSGGGGTATITAPRSGRMVGALAGDPEAGDYLVECNARPAGRGRFGLVARHGGPDSYLSLELEPGVGRKLLACLGGTGIIVPVRVLWQDEGLVEVGRGYALALRCEGDTITVSVDGEEHTATLPGGLPARGRFGLFSAVPAPGCAFTDLVVRSAPRAVVHHWSFTTSRYLGLPDLLDGFVGESWPLPGAAPVPAALAGEAATAAAALTEALLARDGARAALAAAVDAGDAVELEELREVARTAAEGLEQASADAYDALAGALGLPWAAKSAAGRGVHRGR